MEALSREQAQQRADRIRVFRDELETLEREQVLVLSQTQREGVENYHRRLIDAYSAAHDIDINLHEKRLSLGMRISSFLGALALAAAVYFLFERLWGEFTTPVQVVILISAPIALTVLTAWLFRREKTGYFAKISAMVAFVAFASNTVMIGAIFNIAPSENVALVWALFALCLAYALGARLILAFGILSVGAFLSAKTATWSGLYWLSFGRYPEHFLLAAVLIFALAWLPHRRFKDFPPVYRVFSLLFLFLPLLVLANWGRASRLPWGELEVEMLYQTAAFILSAAAIFFGVKRSWNEVTNTGVVFFVIFLYTKFFDWW